MMNIQLCSESESQESHFLGQVFQGETSNFWGLECLESGWTGVLLKDIINIFYSINLVMFKKQPAENTLMFQGVQTLASHLRSVCFLSRAEAELFWRSGSSSKRGTSFGSSLETLKRKHIWPKLSVYTSLKRINFLRTSTQLAGFDGWKQHPFPWLFYFTVWKGDALSLYWFKVYSPSKLSLAANLQPWDMDKRKRKIKDETK